MLAGEKVRNVLEPVDKVQDVSSESTVSCSSFDLKPTCPRCIKNKRISRTLPVPSEETVFGIIWDSFKSFLNIVNFCKMKASFS